MEGAGVADGGKHMNSSSPSSERLGIIFAFATGLKEKEIKWLEELLRAPY